EHLYEMDYLQEGIGLRAMGQRDPLVEYQREGFDMFQTMMEGIKEESVRLLFNVEVQIAGQETEAAPAENVAVAPAPPAGAAALPAAVAPLALPDAAEDDRAAARRTPPEVPAAPAPPAAPPVFVKGLEPRRPTGGLRYTAPSVDGGAGPVTILDSGAESPVAGGAARAARGPAGGSAAGASARPARNAPCPCGSGRKYKRCHGDPARRNAEAE
ncbi:SEC-C metal-binding domain-containing protein, partial [Frankia sp. AvcI1]